MAKAKFISILMILALVCLLAVPQPALAVVTVTLEDGVLTITGEGGDDITITCDEGGLILVNDAPITVGEEGWAWSLDITAIVVIGGDGDNFIDLGGLNPFDLSNIEEMISIDAGAGKDSILGSGLDDQIVGGDGDDEIHGNEGNDEIHGGPDDDIIDGDEGNDVIHGDEGHDVIHGGPGEDEIDAGPGDDVVNAGEGHDFIITTPGSFDTISDTDGEDTMDFSEAAAGIELDVDLTGEEQAVDVADNTMQIEGQFEKLIGSRFDDVVRVDPLEFTPRDVVGGDGDDTLNFDCMGVVVTDNGETLTTADFAPVTYADFETVNIIGVFCPDLGVIIPNQGISHDPESEPATYDPTNMPPDVTWENAKGFYVEANGPDGDYRFDIGFETPVEIGATLYKLPEWAELPYGIVGPNTIWVELNIADGILDPAFVLAGGVTVTLDEDGLFTVDTGDGDNEVTITCEAGVILVNDIPITLPGGGGAPAGAEDIAEIAVEGGLGDNVIDLSDLNPADLPNIVTEPSIEAAEGDDFVIGSGFGDLIDGGPGNDDIFGGDGNDEIVGDEGDDEIDGGPGDDIIDGGPGDDTVDGGDGNDHFIAIPDGFDTFGDTDGDDTLDFSEAAAAIALDVDLIGEEQVVDDAANRMRLEGQFEKLISSTFDDMVRVDPLDVPRDIDGENGNDTLNFDCRGVIVTDDGATLTAEGFAPVTYANFEMVNVIGVFCTDPVVNVPGQGVSEEPENDPATYDPENMPPGVTWENAKGFCVEADGPDGDYGFEIGFETPVEDGFILYKLPEWTEVPYDIVGPNTIQVELSVVGGVLDPPFVLSGSDDLPIGAVGGEAYPVNKLGILAPWIILAVLLIGGVTWLTLRRRRAQG